jgi:hypothetical protein
VTAFTWQVIARPRSVSYRDVMVTSSQAINANQPVGELLGGWRQRRRLSQLDLALVGIGSSEQLQAHHLTYKRRGYEKHKDLTTICNSSHEPTHQKSL